MLLDEEGPEALTACRLTGANVSELFWYRIIGALVLAAFVAVTMLEVGPVLTLLLAVVAGALRWLVHPRLVRRAIRRTVSRIANASALGPTWPDSADVGRSRGPRGVCGIGDPRAMGVLGRIDESGEHAYIFISPIAAFILPKRAGTKTVNALLNSLRARQGSMNTSLDSAG